MDTDKIIRETGGCGIFQILLVTAVYVNRFCQAWGEIFMAFGAYNPGWICTDNNLTLKEDLLDLQQNESTTSVTGQENKTSSYTKNNCEAYQRCSNVTFNVDSSTIVTEWNLICDRDWITSVIISVQMCGGILGILVTGYASDALGRRIGLFTNIAFYSIFNTIAVFSNSWQMYAVVRFFIGITNGGILVNVNPYALEFVDSSWRSVLTALPDWNIGVAIFAIAAWILKDWRYLHILSAVQAGACFFIVFWIPDSMRWLAVHNKVPKAKLVMEKICKLNRMPKPITDFLEDIAEVERKRKGQKSSYTYIDLIKTPGYLHKTIAMFLLWFFLSLSYFSLNFGIKSFSGNFYLNFLLFPLIALPGMVVMPYLANKLGRKGAIILFLLPSAIMSFTVVLMSFVAEGNLKETGTTVLALLTSVCLDSTWVVNVVFVVELFPTVVRSLGYGTTLLGVRFGSIVAPYLVSSGTDNIYISYSIMGSVLLLSCGIIFSLPETARKPLEDTIRPVSVINLSAVEGYCGGDEDDDREDDAKDPLTYVTQKGLTVA